MNRKTRVESINWGRRWKPFEEEKAGIGAERAVQVVVERVKRTTKPKKKRMG